VAERVLGLGEADEHQKEDGAATISDTMRA